MSYEHSASHEFDLLGFVGRPNIERALIKLEHIEVKLSFITLVAFPAPPQLFSEALVHFHLIR